MGLITTPIKYINGVFDWSDTEPNTGYAGNYTFSLMAYFDELPRFNHTLVQNMTLHLLEDTVCQEPAYIDYSERDRTSWLGEIDSKRIRKTF